MPRPVEPQPVGKPSRSPPPHLPVAGSFFDGAVGIQCTHSKLRNSPSFFAATNAPSCASFGEEVGSSLPCASMRPPGSLSKGMSKVVYVPGTQSTGLPVDGIRALRPPAPSLAAGVSSGKQCEPHARDDQRQQLRSHGDSPRRIRCEADTIYKTALRSEPARPEHRRWRPHRGGLPAVQARRGLSRARCCARSSVPLHPRTRWCRTLSRTTSRERGHVRRRR